MQGLPKLTLKEMRFYKRISAKLLQQNPLGNTLEYYFQALQNERREPSALRAAEVQLQAAIHAQESSMVSAKPKTLKFYLSQFVKRK